MNLSLSQVGILLLSCIPFGVTFGSVGKLGNKFPPTTGQRLRISVKSVNKSLDTHGFPTFPFSAGHGRGGPPSRGNDRRGAKRGTIFPFTFPSSQNTSPFGLKRTRKKRPLNHRGGDNYATSGLNSSDRRSSPTEASVGPRASSSVNRKVNSGAGKLQSGSNASARMEAKDCGPRRTEIPGKGYGHKSTAAITTQSPKTVSKKSTGATSRASKIVAITQGDLLTPSTGRDMITYSKATFKRRSATSRFVTYSTGLVRSNTTHRKHSPGKLISCRNKDCKSQKCIRVSLCGLRKSLKTTWNKEVFIISVTFLICAAILGLITLKRLRVTRRVGAASIARVI